MRIIEPLYSEPNDESAIFTKNELVSVLMVYTTFAFFEYFAIYHYFRWVESLICWNLDMFLEHIFYTRTKLFFSLSKFQGSF